MGTSMSRVRFKLDPHVPLLLSYRHEIGFVYYSISTLIGFTCQIEVALWWGMLILPFDKVVLARLRISSVNLV